MVDRSFFSLQASGEVCGVSVPSVLPFFHINGHPAFLPAPRIMKDNLIAARYLTEVAIFFGALTPHINVTRATNPYPKLLPLSTHSKQAVFRLESRLFWSSVSCCIFAPHLISS